MSNLLHVPKRHPLLDWLAHMPMQHVNEAQQLMLQHQASHVAVTCCQTLT